MNPIQIRAAVAADVADIATVHVDSFLTTYPHLPATRRSAETGLDRRRAIWERRLRQPERSILVAISDGTLCGFVDFGPGDDPATGHVFSIHVSPGSTGRGVGGELMAGAVDALRERGYESATLFVVVDNVGARRFYERLDWCEEPVRRRERLAVGDEPGDEVEVVRYRLDLVADP